MHICLCIRVHIYAYGHMHIYTTEYRARHMLLNANSDNKCYNMFNFIVVMMLY